MAKGRRARICLLAAALVAVAVAPAPAQVVCRPNALGSEVCTGIPAPTLRGREPYIPDGRGLGAVQQRVRPLGGSELTAARRTDVLGNTFLEASELPPSRPLAGVAETRRCVRDALGNLTCR